MTLIISLLGFSFLCLTETSRINDLVAVVFERLSKDTKYYKGNGEEFATSCMKRVLPFFQDEMPEEFTNLSPLHYLNCTWPSLPQIWPLDHDLFFDSFNQNWYVTLGGHVFMFNYRGEWVKFFWMGTSVIKLRVDNKNGVLVFSDHVKENLYQLKIAPMDKTSMLILHSWHAPFTFDIVPNKQKIIFNNFSQIYEMYFDGSNQRELGKAPEGLINIVVLDDHLVLHARDGFFLQEIGQAYLTRLIIPEMPSSYQWTFSFIDYAADPLSNPISTCLINNGGCGQICYSYHRDKGKPHCLCSESSLLDSTGRCQAFPAAANTFLIAKGGNNYSALRLSGEYLINVTGAYHGRDERLIEGQLCTFSPYGSETKVSCRSFMSPEGEEVVKLTKYIRNRQNATFSTDQINQVVFLYDGLSRLLVCLPNLISCKAIVSAEIKKIKADGKHNLVFYTSPSNVPTKLCKAVHTQWSCMPLFIEYEIVDFFIDYSTQQIAILYHKLYYQKHKRIAVINYNGVGLSDVPVSESDDPFAHTIVLSNGINVIPVKTGAKFINSGGIEINVFFHVYGHDEVYILRTDAPDYLDLTRLRCTVNGQYMCNSTSICLHNTCLQPDLL